MRISKAQTFAGVPAMKVRDLLHRYGGGGRMFTNIAIAEKCGVSAERAAELAAELVREGLIELDSRDSTLPASRNARPRRT